MGRKITNLILTLAIFIAAFILRTLWLAGVFTHVEPRAFGRCQWVKGPVGPEDIAIHPATGIAFISACDRRALEHEPKPGAIFAYDLNRHDAPPVNLTPQADLTFQPHGISLWVDPQGHDVLFVISHPPADKDGTRRHRVDMFDIVDGQLKLHASVGGPALVTPNDLVAAGPDRFYLTNTHKNPPGLWQTIETYLRLAGAQVLYFDGQELYPVIDDLVLPNGINLSPNGRLLYVASTTSHRVRIYDRDPARPRELRFRRDVYLGMGADNIDVQPDGTVWVAGHPKLLNVGAHGANPAKLSPSEVFRFRPDGDAELMYANLGEEISGASVAAVYEKRMLIGQIFDDGFLDCTLP